jgi:hypothetical protein
MNKLPPARSTDIVVQELGKEILIYDLNTHKAYNLNETSSIVYQACDGKTSFDELRVKTRFTHDIIFLAIDALKKENLLENTEEYKSPFTGINRREVIRRVGVATMIALPVISSLIAPTAAMAQSATCTNSGAFCICNDSPTDAGGTCPDAARCGLGCVCRTYFCKSNGTDFDCDGTCLA